ncbi:MAG: N-acetyl-gamma-glutamyl-phosphate reductase [Isosphaeraceae bacterium]
MRRGELIAILLRHPHARITAATSRQDEAPRLDALHPSLARRIDLPCEPFDPGRRPQGEGRLPVPAARRQHGGRPPLMERGLKVIDLGADYRLKSAATYAEWYNHEHTDPARLAEAVYGLPELYRDDIPAARLIANPGCYTSTSILALAPLIAEDLVDRPSIIIDAKSGVSGGGRSPKPAFHYPECNESISAYSVGRHRHTPEIEQVLTDVGRSTGGPVEVLFTPHLVPMDRGILATIYTQPRGTAVERDLIDLYRSYYADSPFVRIVNHPPATKDTSYTNFCDIMVRVVRGRILVMAALDNLIKGASGVAVQNFNLMRGHPGNHRLALTPGRRFPPRERARPANHRETSLEGRVSRCSRRSRAVRFGPSIAFLLTLMPSAAAGQAPPGLLGRWGCRRAGTAVGGTWPASSSDPTRGRTSWWPWRSGTTARPGVPADSPGRPGIVVHRRVERRPATGPLPVPLGPRRPPDGGRSRIRDRARPWATPNGWANAGCCPPRAGNCR